MKLQYTCTYNLLIMEVSGGGDGCRGLYSVQKDFKNYDHSIFHYMANVNGSEKQPIRVVQSEPKHTLTSVRFK